MSASKVERLAALVGGKAVLAWIVERDPAVVSRMIREGKVRVEFNSMIRAHVAGARYDKATTMEILSLLEPDVCPHCGQPMPAEVV